MKNRLVLSIGSIALIGLCIGAYLLYRAETTGVFDERLQMAIQGVQNLKTYEMVVDTRTVVSERNMRISGLYLLDFAAKRYGSFATTTISTPERLEGRFEHSFSLQNLSIGNDIYVKIETESPLLKKTIPHSEHWRHFVDSAIPPQFNNIAVSGPVLDTLAIFGSGGIYLTLNDDPTDVPFGTSTARIYSFSLSKRAQTVAGGTLKSLIQRVSTGTVDVLIDESSTIRSVVVHGVGYESTSTIMHVNTPLVITAPTEVE